jgi:hypothetical protein
MAAFAVVASGCSTSSEAGRPTVMAKMLKPEVPATARQKCADPVQLPDRDLSEREATDYWSRDRAALRSCEPRRAAAVRAADGGSVTAERPRQ